MRVLQVQANRAGDKKLIFCMDFLIRFVLLLKTIKCELEKENRQ